MPVWLELESPSPGRHGQSECFAVECHERRYMQSGRHPLQEIIVSSFVPNDVAVSVRQSVPLSKLEQHTFLHVYRNFKLVTIQCTWLDFDSCPRRPHLEQLPSSLVQISVERACT